MLPAGPHGAGQGPGQLFRCGAGRRPSPEGDVAQVRREVVGGAEPADLGRGHRPEHEPPQELGPLALAVAGDLDLGVAVHGGQPDADGVGQGPQQLHHLQRHRRGAAGGGGRLGEELPDLVDGEPVGGQHVLHVHALVGPFPGGHRSLGQLGVARQAAGQQRLAGRGAVPQGRRPQGVVAHVAIGREHLAQRPQGGVGDLVVTGGEAGHHRPDLAVPRRPVDAPPWHRRTVEVSNHVVAILEKSPSPGPGPSIRLTLTTSSDMRG